MDETLFSAGITRTFWFMETFCSATDSPASHITGPGVLCTTVSRAALHDNNCRDRSELTYLQIAYVRL